MAEVVNLRQFKKSRVRDEKRARGDRNAALFGRSKALKAAEAAAADKASHRLEAHRLESDPAYEDD